jgi:hypothetical protein
VFISLWLSALTWLLGNRDHGTSSFKNETAPRRGGHVGKHNCLAICEAQRIRLTKSLTKTVAKRFRPKAPCSAGGTEERGQKGAFESRLAIS